MKWIVPSPQNVRRNVSEESIKELADSIRTVGLLQPVVLRGEFADPRPYELVVGQRRFLAYQELGWDRIPAIFAGGIEDTDARIQSLVENVVRAQLNHADLAEAVTDLYKRFDRDEQKVVDATALTLGMVRKYIHIQEFASPQMKKLLQEKKVRVDDIKRALRAAQYEIKKAEKLLDLMAQHQLNRHQKARLAEYGENNPRASPHELIKQAEEPRIEPQILVRVPDAVRQALHSAAQELDMSEEDVAAQAVQEWLSERGFISA